MAYTLEIYEPGSTNTVSATYESETPFGAISKGDTVIAADADDAPTRILVKSVEHVIWYPVGKPVRHKIMVFGDPVP